MAEKTVVELLELLEVLPAFTCLPEHHRRLLGKALERAREGERERNQAYQQIWAEGYDACVDEMQHLNETGEHIFPANPYDPDSKPYTLEPPR